MTVRLWARDVKPAATLRVMNMTLSKRGDYVVRSALALARAWPAGESRKIREVVAEMGVPQTFASQILADLVRAGLATSKSGKDGGYRLSRDPSAISLVEVVEAGEGPLRSERCALGEGPCRWDAVCPLHETWRAATDALREALASTNLSQLVAQDVALEQGKVTAPTDSHRHAGASLEVSASVLAAASLDAVDAALADDELLAGLVARAYGEAEAVRMSVLPAGSPWGPMRAAVRSRPAEAADAPAITARPRQAGGGPGLVRSLSWEASGVLGAQGCSSHADLVLGATGAGPGRTELEVSGNLRPPEGSAEERIAKVALRSFLRQLAGVAEEPDGRPGPPQPTDRAPGAAPASARKRPGPRQASTRTSSVAAT